MVSLYSLLIILKSTLINNGWNISHWLFRRQLQRPLSYHSSIHIGMGRKRAHDLLSRIKNDPNGLPAGCFHRTVLLVSSFSSVISQKLMLYKVLRQSSRNTNSFIVLFWKWKGDPLPKVTPFLHLR